MLQSMDERGTTNHEDQALVVARRLAQEFGTLACQRLVSGDTQDAALYAEWQQYLDQIANGADPTKIGAPRRPAPHAGKHLASSG